MIKKKSVNRCKYCKKILRDYNHSGMCSACRNAKLFLLDDKTIKNAKVL